MQERDFKASLDEVRSYQAGYCPMERGCGVGPGRRAVAGGDGSGGKHESGGEVQRKHAGFAGNLRGTVLEVRKLAVTEVHEGKPLGDEEEWGEGGAERDDNTVPHGDGGIVHA